MLVRLMLGLALLTPSLSLAQDAKNLLGVAYMYMAIGEMCRDAGVAFTGSDINRLEEAINSPRFAEIGQTEREPLRDQARSLASIESITAEDCYGTKQQLVLLLLPGGWNPEPAFSGDGPISQDDQCRRIEELRKQGYALPACETQADTMCNHIETLRLQGADLPPCRNMD